MIVILPSINWSLRIEVNQEVYWERYVSIVIDFDDNNNNGSKKVWTWSKHIIRNTYAEKSICSQNIWERFSLQNDHFWEKDCHLYEHSQNCVWDRMWSAQMLWESKIFLKNCLLRTHAQLSKKREHQRRWRNWWPRLKCN